MTKAKRSIVVALSLLLADCGTDVKRLLDDESRSFWRAERIVTTAEELGLGLENPVFAAESEKLKACGPINDATRERLYEGGWSLVEHFWSDLTQLIVRIVPVESVEECAEAHERYNREVENLREGLEDIGIDLPPLE